MNPLVIKTPPPICVIGDVHGHLQLALCMAARWQRDLNLQFEAVLLCGDVGTFTDETQLDNATRRHGRDNRCELEFLELWSKSPQPRWLSTIFAPTDDGGLGLMCPVVMVHGNHEGFEHLATLCKRRAPADTIAIEELPPVDTEGFVRYLPSGWRCRTPSGQTIAGIGGIQPGQRRAAYHELAYIDERAVLRLLDGSRSDLLITHQGPSATQEEYGSPLLDELLSAEVARVWFHGHGVRHAQIVAGGPRKLTQVVPLEGVPFATRGRNAGEPGHDAWSCVSLNEQPLIVRERPAFWREYRQQRWLQTPEGILVCPDLVSAYWGDH